jgi:hypothetical protein
VNPESSKSKKVKPFNLKGAVMLYHARRRGSLFLAMLALILFSVLLFSAQISPACGNCPLKKTCAAAQKTAANSCPHGSVATQTAKTQAYACPMHPEVTSDKPGRCDKCSMKLTLMDTPSKAGFSGAQVTNPEAFKKVERYVCSMHPEVVEKKTGNCPECGMKLVQAEFYEVYVCPMKECPHLSEKDGECCGKKMNKKLMSSEEFERLTSVPASYLCPMHPEVTSDKPGNCSKCKMKLEKKPRPESKEGLSYTCPMHPGVSLDKPGNCPECGMKLKRSTMSAEESTKI